MILLCPDPLQAVDRWDLAQPRRSEGPLQCSEQVPAISPNGLGVRLAGGGAGRQAILLDAAALALDPPPDGGYPGGNTAEGDFALSALTSGMSNTATGHGALFSNTNGSENTATGNLALAANTTGGDNTATGDVALAHNTTGNANTATGVSALRFNTTGSFNTANGAAALFSNTTGSANTAMGFNALVSNTTGVFNIACGKQMTITDLALTIHELAESSSTIEYSAERLGDVKHSVASVDKTQRAGFRPACEFAAGLRATIEFFRNNIAGIERGPQL